MIKNLYSLSGYEVLIDQQWLTGKGLYLIDKDIYQKTDNILEKLGECQAIYDPDDIEACSVESSVEYMEPIDQGEIIYENKRMIWRSVKINP